MVAQRVNTVHPDVDTVHQADYVDAVHKVDTVNRRKMIMDRATILGGNGAFVATGGHEGLAMMPRRRVMIIGCADPRVDPEKVLQMGDAAVIRNIGGRVTGPTLATIAGLRSLGAKAALAAAQSGTGPGMDLVVLHHTDCDILQLADEPESLARFLGTDLAHLGDMHVQDPHVAVAHDVAVLRSIPMPGLRVWGLVYDVATGAVEITATPEQAAA
jgi:carbonic anhydrase